MAAACSPWGAVTMPAPGSCCSLGNAAGQREGLSLQHSQENQPWTSTSHELRGLWLSSTLLTRKLSRSNNLLLFMLRTLEEEQNHPQSEGTWAPFQFHIFRKKDEPLTPKKVLKEKLAVLTSP